MVKLSGNYEAPTAKWWREELIRSKRAGVSQRMTTRVEVSARAGGQVAVPHGREVREFRPVVPVQGLIIRPLRQVRRRVSIGNWCRYFTTGGER